MNGTRRKGIPHINTHHFMGFDKDDEGRLVINEKEAAVVRRIFKEFLEGATCSTIAARLNEEGVPGVTGEPKWINPTIKGMLSNEKYMGDSLLQKHVTVDYLTKRQVRNDGEVTQYYVKDSHEPIVSKEEWNTVQQKIERQEIFRERHKIGHYGYGGEKYPFCTKIVCGECGHVYSRKAHFNRTQKVYWQCYTRSKKGPKFCKAENIPEEMIQRVFIEAWNSIVRDQEKMKRRWDQMEKEGTELEQLRARQMRELVQQGPLTTIVPELVQTMLESITVKGGGAFDIRFLDGTVFTMKF